MASNQREKNTMEFYFTVACVHDAAARHLGSRSEGWLRVLAGSEGLHQVDLEESHGRGSQQYRQHGAVNLEVTSRLLLSLYLGLLLRGLQSTEDGGLVEIFPVSASPCSSSS